jgi:mannosyltransferase
MKKSIVNSDAIICVSHNTKNDLLKYLPKVDRTKINVVHNGVSDCFHQIDSSYSDENFLLYVGGRQSYKNFHILIKVLEKLNGYTLKFIGGGKLTNKEKLLLDKSLHNRYTHIQSINNYDLNLLYNKAFCLVYPSIYEGFGLPLIEAQSSGCPVIATKISSFPEIVGNSAILLNNMNTDNIISAVKVLENPANRNKYVRLGLKNSKRFSYDLMTKKYLDIYKKV